MSSTGSRGFFKTAVDQLVEARSRQAARYVASALLRLDDATLKAHGYNREVLRRKAGPSYPL